MALQSVFIPQVAKLQGSTHFWFSQDLSNKHSELVRHSGRQLGGEPVKLGIQEQMAWPFISLHWLWGPQGEGWHGFLSTIGEIAI